MTIAGRSIGIWLQLGGLIGSGIGLAAAFVTRQGFDLLFAAAAVVATVLDALAIRIAPSAAAIALAAMKLLVVAAPITVAFFQRAGVPDRSLVSPDVVLFVLVGSALLSIAGSVDRRLTR